MNYSNSSSENVSLKVSTYKIYRSSDWIPLPPNQPELDYVSHDPLDSSDIINIVTAVIGIIGNLMTLAVLINSKKLHTVPNLFVGHLALIDFFVCSSIIVQLFTRNHEVCLYLAPAIIMVMCQSLVSMANIAVNRYILICRDRQLYSKIYTKRNIALIVLAGYIYIALALSPPYLGYGQYTYNVKFQCCYIAAYDLHSYIHGCFLLGLVMGPVVVTIVCCYYKIIKKFRESQKNITQRMKMAANNGGGKLVEQPVKAFMEPGSPVDEDTTPNPSMTEGLTPTDDATHCLSVKSDAKLRKKSKEESAAMKAYKKTRKRDIRAFKSIVSMMAVFAFFVISWMPSELTYLYDFWGRLPSRLHTHLIAIAWINSCNNIFVYAGLNPQFRKRYIQLLKCDWKNM